MDQTETGEARQTGTISLLDLLSVVIRRRRFVLFSTLFGFILVALFSIYTVIVPATSPYNPMPNRYTPVAQVRVVESQSNSLSNGSQNSVLGALASLAGGSASGATAPTTADVALALLRGNTLADDVAEHFDFVKRYHISIDPQMSQRRIFERNLSTMYDRTTGILTISYTSIDKHYATRVLSYTLEALRKRFNTLSSRKTVAQRDYIAARLERLKLDLQEAQNNLINYQVEHGIIDISTQAQNQVSEIARVSAEIHKSELQIQTLKKYGRTENDPSIVHLRNSIQIQQDFINQLKNGGTSYGINTIPQSQLPRISATYSNLKADVTLQEKIYAVLLGEYETARLEAAAGSNVFEVVQQPQVPEAKSGPDRVKISAIITIMVLFVAVFVAFIMDYFERAKLDPIESLKLNRIKEMLRQSRQE